MTTLKPPRRVLLIAFHFPPLHGSSGIQRTLRFAQYLPDYGWAPTVLTVTPNAYEKTSDDLLRHIPDDIVVKRAIGFDTARQLSIFGRYPRFLATPDRWVSWLPHAYVCGLRHIQQHKPDAIWSTYPIATAHLIAAKLHKHSGLPWIADFRDPMAQDGYPANPKIWASYKKIEETAAALSAYCTFASPGAVRMYQSRYPAYADKIKLIENGYDQEAFDGICPEASLNPGKITLLHSGIIYPYERDPSHFLQALRRLLDQGGIGPKNFCLRLRASGHDSHLGELIARFGLQAIVELAPPIPYRQALTEMTSSDGLVILQASNCNDQIPAKLYEYLRTGRPILGLTDPQGDTAWAMRQAGANAIAPLDDTDKIVEALRGFLNAVRNGENLSPDPELVSQSNRRDRAGELAQLLERVAT